MVRLQAHLRPRGALSLGLSGLCSARVPGSARGHLEGNQPPGTEAAPEQEERQGLTPPTVRQARAERGLAERRAPCAGRRAGRRQADPTHQREEGNLGPLGWKGILQVQVEQEERTAKRLPCVSLPRLLLFLCLDVPGPSPVLRVLVQAELQRTPTPGSLGPVPVR